jgi:hypothetical protein
MTIAKTIVNRINRIYLLQEESVKITKWKTPRSDHFYPGQLFNRTGESLPLATTRLGDRLPRRGFHVAI